MAEICRDVLNVQCVMITAKFTSKHIEQSDSEKVLNRLENDRYEMEKKSATASQNFAKNQHTHVGGTKSFVQYLEDIQKCLTEAKKGLNGRAHRTSKLWNQQPIGGGDSDSENRRRRQQQRESESATAIIGVGDGENQRRLQ
ncbi:hypothetical protein L484_009985 [Morus notabilis]|uniref:Uncharacterized protein n=1 Tax=Morus notabilis TaxID=981085 RepID=W9S520_9ROSA|nr:hypothetical protein L484_009985 [Morus notabilis]